MANPTVEKPFGKEKKKLTPPLNRIKKTTGEKEGGKREEKKGMIKVGGSMIGGESGDGAKVRKREKKELTNVSGLRLLAKSRAQWADQD